MGLFDSGTATNTTQSKPWAAQIRPLRSIIKKAGELYNDGAFQPKYYPGSTVAGFSREQNQAFRKGANMALNGNRTVGLAEDFNRDILKGKYNQDPYQSQVYSQIENKVLPSVNSMFSAAGRYGSGAHMDSAASALTREFAPYASQMHQAGLDRMERAGQNSFGFADQGFKNMAALEGIGQKKQQLGQLELNDAVKRWDTMQNAPADALARYQQMVSGNYGGSQTTEQATPSMFSQLLGGGLGIAGLLGGLF